MRQLQCVCYLLLCYLSCTCNIAPHLTIKLPNELERLKYGKYDLAETHTTLH